MIQPLPPPVIEMYVAPQGKDHWSGRLAAPNAAGTDGPLASLAGARDAIRALKQPSRAQRDAYAMPGIGGPIVVWLRGGRYPLTAPVVFGPQDTAPVTYAAYPGETAIIDGGVRITNWQVGTVNGKTAWTADLPEVAAGKWAFRELFVNGERCPRPRLPRQGLYRMVTAPGLKLPAGWGGGGQTQFTCNEGEVRGFRNLNEVEVVYVHFWIEERSPIAAFDAATRTVTMARPSRTALVGAWGTALADYYLDNVFEALEQPGEWYLDRAAGKLYYLPRPGETPEQTEVYAPRLLQLVKLVGDPEAGRFVEFLRFHGLTFQHTDWRHPGEDAQATVDLSTKDSVKWVYRGDTAACGQAAADVPAVIRLYGARFCAFTDCTVRNAGWYAFDIADGCTGIRVIGNDLYDLGAGGVKLNGSAAGESLAGRSGYHRITDNHLHHAGQIFHSAVGILSMHSFGNVIAHNHIHDLYYSGISVGWVWGYSASVSENNTIEFNHIHDIGQGLLSDMGGVYLLGVQPGTVVRNNLVHDVVKAHYGGWALYTDEGSSHVVLENNVCYRTNGEIFHQHYGRENIWRNNILAYGGDAMLAYSRVEPHVGLTFTGNIMLSKGAPMFQHDFGPGARRIVSDLNLFWDETRAVPVLNRAGEQTRDLTQWRALGYDQHSLVADPKFRDPAHGDFGLPPDSPAWGLGFKPIDLSTVGPRPPDQRPE